ncbi:MAG: hypothetical protein JXR34_09030, partial [Bacteroidales bacterium]|nr:hypothetical protein [Bacteroidales bacterium]
AVYQNLKLRPDYSIEFPNKERLRIRPHISWYNTVAYRYISSIAAVLVVFLYFPALINNGVMDQTIYHQPTEFQTSQPQELSSSQTLFKTDENTPSSKDDAIAEAKPAESAIKVAKKPTRNKTTLQKFSSRKPEPKLNLTSNLTPIKPNVCFASQSKTYGYYQVSLQKDNFINNNPELKKRLIKGLRKSLNINNDEIKTPDDKLTLWDLADFGAKSLSNLTETDITITRK